MATKPLNIDGSNLKLADILNFVENKGSQVALSNKTLAKLNKNHSFLQKNLTKRVIYGINTGFGPMASHLLGQHQLFELQENLIRSHAVGMGTPVAEEFVLAAMLVRLNTLAKGYSGIHPQLAERLAVFLNKKIVPLVPEHGAVGTSGDLVQLAHIALGLLGEGNVQQGGKVQPAGTVLKKFKLAPYKLRPKEGLALINGTSFMAGIGSLLAIRAERLVSLSIQLGALSLELVQAFSDSISKDLHGFRPHKGQAEIANTLRLILKTSSLLRSRKNGTKNFHINGDVQDLGQAIQEVYSLRCIAQILGPIAETLQKTQSVLEIEINSVTDNPVVNHESGELLHGGNFHGDYVAAGLDQMKAAVTKLTMLSERRINYFLNRNINKKFPPFLNLKKPGLTLALQGLQFVATSTTALSQSLSYPHHLHSIPTNGDNQDVVSMGTDGAMLAAKVLDNAHIVLAIELVTLMQAVDCLEASSRLSQPNQKLYRDVRAIFPVILQDRPAFEELESVRKFVAAYINFSD